MKKVLFRIIIPMLILAVWMIMCYPVCAKADGVDYFLYWIMVGCPYGIRKMSMFLVPKNLGIAGSIGIRLYHWWVDWRYDCYNQNYQYSYGNNKIDIGNFWT